MRLCFLLIAAALAATANAAEEHVGANAERGDPARWAEPADTPQKKYRNAMQEALAAQAEALKECRAQTDRKACESEARRQYAADAERARTHLTRPNQG